MAYHIPRELSVTMGVELTFVPAMFERVYNDTDGKVVLWKPKGYGVTQIYSALASALGEILNGKKIEVFSCHTDPECVEVPTIPFKSGNKIKKNIHAIRKCAQMVDLTPTAGYTVGGGAHIHTGYPAGVNRGHYARHMTHFANHNPWLSYAFAGWNDNQNAVPVLREHLEEGQENPADKIGYYRRVIFNRMCDIRELTVNIVRFEGRLHNNRVWQSSYDKAEIQNLRDNYAKARLEYIRKYHAACNALLEYMADNLDVKPTVESKLIPITSFRPAKGKRYAVTDRGDTIEFRCFIMPDHISGHVKQIALVDSICRLAIKKCDAGVTRVAPLLGEKDIPTKYSELKKGFHNMLRELGFNPKDFRAETVNMARKLRYIRAQRFRG